MWRQVRELAGAVMCETRDLGRKWPYWHTLILDDETRIDMRFVSPRDVKKMLVQRARSVYWKHEYKELKKGVWIEPAPALLRKKVREERTVGRMKVSVKFATRRKAQESTGFATVENGRKPGGRFRRPSESGSKKRERRRKSGSGKEVSSRTPLIESQWNRGYFSMTKWESEKHKSWCMPEDADGSLLGMAGKW